MSDQTSQLVIKDFVSFRLALRFGTGPETKLTVNTFSTVFYANFFPITFWLVLTKKKGSAVNYIFLYSSEYV